MTTQPPEGDFPPVHPTGGLNQFTRPDFLTRLPNFIQFLIELVLGGVVSALTGGFIGGPLGSAFSQLTSWATNALPAQIREPLGQLVTLLVTVLDSIPVIGPPLGNAVEDLAALFGLMNTKTTEAQASADVANIGVVSLNAQLASIIAPPGGVYISDNFDRTASNLGANWVEVYEPSLAGSADTNGNDAYWNSAGGAARIGHFRHITPVATDTQMCSIVQTAPRNASNTDPDLRLILRADSALDNFVLAIIRHNGVEIGYIVSGSYTRLGSTETVSTATGDRWELRAGTATDERQFLLYRNDALVCDRTDSADASAMGASNLHVGFGMQAGVNFVFGTGFVQYSPPRVQGFAAADRAA